MTHVGVTLVTVTQRGVPGDIYTVHSISPNALYIRNWFIIQPLRLSTDVLRFRKESVEKLLIIVTCLGSVPNQGVQTMINALGQ